MMISNMVEMIQPSVNTNSTSSSSQNESTEDFASLLKDQAGDTTTNQQSTEQESVTNTEKTDVENTDTATEEGSTTEVTDTQRELMAALYMHMVPVNQQEVVKTYEEMDVNPDEVVLEVMDTATLANETLDMGESEVSSQLGQEVPEEVLELLAETEDDEVVFTLDTAVDAVVEVPEELEIVEEQPEIRMEPVEVEPETEEVEVKTVNTAPVQSNDEDEEVLVTENSGEGTKLFEKVESTPVKVAEVVNTQEPNFEEEMAKIISNANANGESVVTIQMTPDNLGMVTIQLTQSADGVLQILMQASDSSAQSLLNRHADSLANLLGGTNNTVTVEVQVAETEAGEEAQQGDHSDQQEQDQNQQQNDGEEDVFSEDFMQQLRLGLLGMTPTEE